MKSLELGWTSESPALDVRIVGTPGLEGDTGDDQPVFYKVECSFQIDTESGEPRGD